MNYNEYIDILRRIGRFLGSILIFVGLFIFFLGVLKVNEKLFEERIEDIDCDGLFLF